MSRVYFHSPSDTAELLGSERAWLGGLVSDLATGMLHLHYDNDALRALLPPGHHIRQRTGSDWADSYALYFRTGDSELVRYRGKSLSTFSLALNTATAVGNDQMKLAARIHGQCELHAWVDGPNRAWLADIMQAGLDSGVYRKGYWYEPAAGGERLWQSMGWESVIGLLRTRDDEPVVMSYSVCDGFPSAYVGDWMSRRPEDTDQDEHSDAWYELDSAEQWRISMAVLRASGDGLEIRPDDWATFRFTHELSVLDLRAPDWEQRVQRALGLESVDA